MSFSQLPAVEKDTEKWAAGNFLGPSYFEATLVYHAETLERRLIPALCVLQTYARVSL